MRIMLVIGLVTALSVGMVAQTTETGTLKVSGMHCGACAATVENAAKKVAGVASVKASQPEGTASVTYDPFKTTLEAVAKAINQQTPFKAEPRGKNDKK
jgi:copper chaperone CopZ